MYRDNIYILPLMCTDVCTCVCGVVLRFALRSLGCKLSLVWIKRNASSHTTYPVLLSHDDHMQKLSATHSHTHTHIHIHTNTHTHKHTHT